MVALIGVSVVEIAPETTADGLGGLDVTQGSRIKFSTGLGFSFACSPFPWLGLTLRIRDRPEEANTESTPWWTWQPNLLD